MLCFVTRLGACQDNRGRDILVAPDRLGKLQLTNAQRGFLDTRRVKYLVLELALISWKEPIGTVPLNPLAGLNTPANVAERKLKTHQFIKKLQKSVLQAW